MTRWQFIQDRNLQLPDPDRQSGGRFVQTCSSFLVFFIRNGVLNAGSAYMGRNNPKPSILQICDDVAVRGIFARLGQTNLMSHEVWLEA